MTPPTLAATTIGTLYATVRIAVAQITSENIQLSEVLVTGGSIVGGAALLGLVLRGFNMVKHSEEEWDRLSEERDRAVERADKAIARASEKEGENNELRVINARLAERLRRHEPD